MLCLTFIVPQYKYTTIAKHCSIKFVSIYKPNNKTIKSKLQINSKCDAQHL